MTDQFLADRRDPVVKQLEREGLQALLLKLHARKYPMPADLGVS